MRLANSKYERVSVVIPAYNEEDTIISLIEVLGKHPLIGEVILVDDGSTDNTELYAKRTSARVFSLPANRGKGEALKVGVEHARYNILFFVDADICGLTHGTINRLVSPVVSGQYDMCIAVRHWRLYSSKKLFSRTPMISGVRVLTKELWNQVPKKFIRAFQEVVALNYFARQNDKKICFVFAPNLTQEIKEQKRGFARGLYQRILMIRDLLSIAIALYVIDRARRMLEDFAGTLAALRKKHKRRHVL